MLSHKTPWFVVLKNSPAAEVRLFCFHYGGGSSGVFRDWVQGFSKEVDLVAVQLPGRGQRYRESPMKTVAEIVPLLLREMIRCLDKPFLIFGHSIGALLAYELTYRLHTLGMRAPLELIVSGAKAPHLPATEPPISHLPDDAFLTKLRALEGTPSEILEDKELMPLLLPMMRADFSVGETYRPTQYEPLQCNVTAFGGRDDRWISEADIAAWKRVTHARFSWEMFDGGHFFIHTCRTELLRYLNGMLQQNLPSARLYR